MKKVFSLKKPAALAAGLLLATFCGCGSFNDYLSKVANSEIALGKQLGEKIATALNEEDKNSFSSLFSYNSRNYEKRFSEKIDYLFGFIDGEVTSSSFESRGSSKRIEYGRKSREIYGNITWETPSATYYAYVSWWDKNDFDENYVGLSFISVGSREDWDDLPPYVTMPCGWEESLYWYKEYGIFTQGFDDGEAVYEKYQKVNVAEYTQAIFAAYKENNKEALKSLFSENAAKNGISQDIDAFFNYVTDEKYLEEKRHFSEGENGDSDCPDHSVDKYISLIRNHVVREYYYAFSDLQDDSYTMCLLYCTRDDEDANNVGLQSILFCPASFGYDSYRVKADKFKEAGTGIFVDTEVKELLGAPSND